MKKLFLMVAVAISLLAASCGNKTNNDSNVCDSTVINCNDSTCKIENKLKEQLSSNNIDEFQNTIEEIQSKYNELIKNGKTEEAKVLASQVKNFIDNHAKEISTITSENSAISNLIDKIKQMPKDAEQKAKENFDNAKDDINDIAGKAEETTKEKISETEKKTENKAKETVEKVKKNAKNTSDAINKAADKILKK